MSRTPRAVAWACGLLAMVVANLVLLGWVLDIPSLTSVRPGLVTMKVNTALCFILSGAALCLLAGEQTFRWRLGLARFCAAIVAVCAGLTLSQDLAGVDLGIDLWLAQEYLPTTGAGSPGRMAPATAFSFILTGLALLLSSAASARLRGASQPPAIIVGAIALVALVGYAYDAPALYRLAPYSSMALHTALLFLALAWGMLAVCPEHRVTHILGSGYAGGAAARRMLPAAIGAPFVLGWMYLASGGAEHFDVAFGFALLVSMNFLIVAALLLGFAWLLNRADEDLKLGEARLRGLLESALDAHLVVNSAGLIVLVNAQAESLFGYRRQELLGKPFALLLPERLRATGTNPIRDFFAEPLPRSANMGVDLTVLRKDGSEVALEFNLDPMRSPDEVLMTGVVPRFAGIGFLPPAPAGPLPGAIRVLLVEADPAEEMVLRQMLAEGTEAPLTLTRAGTLAEAVRLLREIEFDVALLNLVLPDSSGLATLRGLRRAAATTSIVVLASRYDEQLALQTLAEGAEDYVALTQTNAGALGRILRRAFERRAYAQRVRHAERQWRYLIDASPSVIYLAMPCPSGHRCQFVSGSLREVTGFEPDRMISDPEFWLAHVHADDRARVLAELSRTLQQGGGTVEYRFRGAAGEYLWIEDQHRCVLGPDACKHIVGSWTNITARKRADQAARDEKTRYRLLFESAPDGLLLVNRDGRIEEVNANAGAIFGIPAETLVGRAIEDLIPVRLRGAHMRLRENYTKHPAVRQMGARRNLVALRGDGSEFPIAASLSPISIGGSQSILCAVRDISQDARLQAENERFGRMLDQSLNEIYIFAADTLNLVRVNKGARANLGYSADELRLLTPLDLNPEFTRPRFEALIAPLRRGERETLVFETVHRRKDGSTYPVEVHLQLFQDPVQPVFVAFVLDITERRQAQARIAEHERHLSTILGNLPGAVYRCANDPDWTMTFESAGMFTLTGYAAGALESNTPSYGSIIHPGDRDAVWNDVQAALARREPYQLEYRIRTADRREKWVREHGCGVYTQEGEVRYLEGFIWDISERKVQEQQIARLNRVYALLKKINDTIVRFRERSALFWEICRVAVEHGDIGVAWIGCTDGASSGLVPAAFYGEGSEQLIGNRNPQRAGVAGCQRMAETAIAEKRIVVINDLRNL
jgi:PAS domain S-box-containing protein